MNFKKNPCILLILASISSFGQHTDVINSNRPSESQSAFAVGKNVIQVESGLNYINDKHNLLEYHSKGFFIDFTARYGFIKEQMEAIAEISYQMDKYQLEDDEPFKRTGMRSMNMGLKYLFYDPYKNVKEEVNLYSWKANHKFKWSQFKPAISAYAGANLNFSNPFYLRDEKPSYISPKVMLITQNVFGKGLVLITNTFMDKITTDYRQFGYIITLTKGLNDNWSVYFENKGIKSDYYSDGIFSAGGAFLMNKNFQVDFTISKNFKDTPSLFYGGFGLSWRSDTNYKEVKIKVEKEKSKMDKKVEKEAKKNSKKKRVDEIKVEHP
ncbi:MAG: transporter [Flavobacterium sp.]|nr:transporter [Flavobacterium sp.]